MAQSAGIDSHSHPMPSRQSRDWAWGMESYFCLRGLHSGPPMAVAGKAVLPGCPSFLCKTCIQNFPYSSCLATPLCHVPVHPICHLGSACASHFDSVSCLTFSATSLWFFLFPWQTGCLFLSSTSLQVSVSFYLSFWVSPPRLTHALS